MPTLRRVGRHMASRRLMPVAVIMSPRCPLRLTTGGRLSMARPLNTMLVLSMMVSLPVVPKPGMAGQPSTGLQRNMVAQPSTVLRLNMVLRLSMVLRLTTVSYMSQRPKGFTLWRL